jgi:hypothetical protein
MFLNQLHYWCASLRTLLRAASLADTTVVFHRPKWLRESAVSVLLTTASAAAAAAGEAVNA